MKVQRYARLTSKTRALSLALVLAVGAALGLLYFLNKPDGVRSDPHPTLPQAASTEEMVNSREGVNAGDPAPAFARYQASNSLEWVRLMGSPVPNRLFAAAMVSDTLGWATGDEGTILRYDGVSWEAVASPSTYRLYDLVMAGESSGWAVGDYGTVLRMVDGRWAVWPQQLPNVNLHAIAMAGPDTGWAVGRAGTILMYDGGHWNAVESPTNYALNDVVSVSPTLAFAVGGGGTILAWRDGSWSVAPSPTGQGLNAVDMVTQDAGWAVGDGGTILRYDGASWSSVDSPTEDPLHDLLAVAPNDIWAAGQAGLLIHYDGATWDVVTSPATHSLYGLTRAPGGRLWAVGFAATILQYDDDRWESATRLTSADLHDLLWDGNEGWAVGERGRILHDDGEGWLQASAGTSATLFAVSQAAPGDVWAVGGGGAILHCDGAGWVPVTSPTTLTLRGLAFNDAAEGWAVGGERVRSAQWSAGVILHYDGLAWQVEPVSPAGPLHALAFAAPDAGWAVGDEGAIWRYDGDRWSADHSPTDSALWSVAAVSATDVWAVGEAGVMLHYDGHAWDRFGSPTERGLHKVIMTSPGEGWALGDSGTILHYDGLVWQEVPGPTAYRLLGGAADGGGDLWAVGDDGTLLRREFTGGGFRAAVSPRHLFATPGSTSWVTVTASAFDGFSAPITVKVRGPLDVLSTTWSTTVVTPSMQVSLGISLPAASFRTQSGDLTDRGTSSAKRAALSRTSFRAKSRNLAVEGTPSADGDTLSLTSFRTQSGNLVVEGMPSADGDTLSLTSFRAKSRNLAVEGTPSADGDTLSLTSFRAKSRNLVVEGMPSGDGDTLSLTSFRAKSRNLASRETSSSNGSTLSLTVVANIGDVTHSTGLSFTVLPGDWVPGVTLQSGRRLHDLSYDGEAHTWSVGDDGLLWRYDGAEWRRYRSSTSADLYAVKAVSPTLAWAVGENGSCLRFDGTDWLTASTPTTMPLFGLAFTAPDDGWAVGGGGTVLRYDGHDWQGASSPGGDWLYDVAMASDGTGWAVGWGGAIWHYDGAAWQVANSPTGAWLRAVSVIAPDEAWAVGSEGTILHFVTGQWQVVPSPTSARLLDVYFDDSGDGWAIGGDGTILYYGGGQWCVLPHSFADDLRAFDEIGSGYGLAVGNGGRVVCYRGVDARISSLPGCDGEPVPQTSEWPHQVSLPMVSLDSGGEGAIGLFGVQTMGGTFSRDPAIVHQMAEAGIRWARLPFSWKLIEPANTTPDQFHWSVYDDWLELLSTAGIQPQPFLARNPSWAGVLPASHIDQSDEAEHRAFVEAAVARYSAPPYNVSHWEMYNEPDNSTLASAEVGWGMWGDDGAGYAEQLATLYPAVKGADPAAQVLLGGLAYDYFVEDGGSFVRSFITDVLSAGGGAYFDLMNFHYYGPDLTHRIEHLEGVMTTFGLDKPIACTEVSTSLGDPALEDEGELYARYLPKVMMRGLAGGLPIVNWFALGDTESTWRPGLFALDRTTRPAYQAYEVLTKLLREASYLRPLSEGEKSGMALEGYVFGIPEGSGRMDVVWATQQGIVRWQVHSPSVHLIDKYGSTSAVFDPDDGTTDGLVTLPIGADPVYVVYRQQPRRPLGQLLGTSIWPATQIPAQIDRVRNVGANWIRVNIYWDDIEPVKTTPRTYDWEVTDGRVLSVTAAGIQPIGLIGGNPGWAATYPGGPVTDTQDIYEFLQAIAERYDGDGQQDAPGSPIVQVWELYNEADNQDPNSIVYRGYGAWGGRGEEYAQLMKLAREALRSANPTAQIATGGLAHEQLDQPAFDLSFPDALFGYIRDHPGDYFDFFSFHFFPWFGGAYSDWGTDIIGKTTYFREWMDRYGLRWPIIVTEGGHCSWGIAQEPWTSSYDNQARYVPKVFSRSAAADIGATIWLLVSDLAGETNCRYGLSEYDGTPKPAYNAYQTMAGKLGDLLFERSLSSQELVTPEAEGYSFTDPEGRRHVCVVWTNEPYGAGTLRASAPSVIVSDKVSPQWPMTPAISYFEPYTIKDEDDGTADGWTTVVFGHSPVYVELDSEAGEEPVGSDSR